MSLAPHEQRVLASIENSLRRTDPVLATMLATFTVPASRRIRLLRRPGRQIRAGVTAAFLLAAFAALILWGLLAAPDRLARCAARGRAGISSGIFVACASGGPLTSAGRPSGR